MEVILNTLYVTLEKAYLHLDHDTIRVEEERETRLRVPLHHLGSVVCFGNTLVSPALMHRLADEGKVLVLMDRNGRFKARLEGGVSGNVLLRRDQYARLNDGPFMLAAARAFAAGKIKNARTSLMRGAREAKNAGDVEALAAAARGLAASLRALPGALDLDTVRGVEGEAARRYFGAFNLLVRADLRLDFAMDGRTRRPPLDRLNALLSFSYALLMNDCRSALEAVGLDPQAGLFHVLRPGRAALALDLMEEFRPIMDRMALALVNRGQLGIRDFDVREGGAVSLNANGRKVVLVAYQERKQEKIHHPLTEREVPLGLIPLLQARFLARLVRGDMESYIPLTVK